eukprot:Anaeramoba_ignava/c20816_g1_i3.p2 GENE.c20816_g1_i3~~c20816_g1_i3.p2  ORF type:complete len:243 (+),score=-2.23 c20816_g1_i3:65-793(+)
MESNHLKELYEISKDLVVLYVEDDLPLQQKTQIMLNNFFGKVDVSDNGRKGWETYLEYYEKNGRHYDIVITDIKMPIMDGLELSKRILRNNGEQIIVVTSAHDESKYLIEFINIQIKRFIKKPFTLSTVVNTFYDLIKTASVKNYKIELGRNSYWDKEMKKLFNDEKEVKLSHNETVIMDLMVNNPFQIFSNTDLFYTLESENLYNEISEDTIKSAIKRLRKKLPENIIENIYGQGYRIALF